MPRATRPLDPLPAPAPKPEIDDAPSLETLYRQHAGWLRSQLRTRYGAYVAARADDLVQETYVRAAARGVTTIRHPRAFLLRVASRLAIDLTRARRREAGAQADEPQSDPDQDAQVLLKQAILALPPHLRDPFVLNRFGGLTYDQIAARLGVSVKTVEGRMSQALVLCAARLKG